MAEQFTTTFALELDATDAKTGGRDAAEVLQQLRTQISGGIDELKGLQSAFRNMKGSANVGAGALADLKAKIAAQKATVGDATARYAEMGGDLKQLKPIAQQASGGLDQLLARASAAKGPVGGIAKALGGLGTLTRGAVIAAGIVGIAAALIALAAAAAQAAGQLALYGLKQADARRSELLQLEGLTKIRSYLFGLGGGYQRAADSAGFLQSTIDRVSAGVAIGRDKVVEYASQLYKMGLRAGNLQDALEGVAITSATQGEQQAGIFASWAAGAAAVGQSVKALSNDVKARLGGIAKAQLLSLDVQTRKLRENVSLLFSGLKIEGILKGIATITEMFSQASASGRAMKVIIETLGNTLGGIFEGPALIAKRFFQGLVIGALYLTIGILKVRNWLRATFGDSSILKGLSAQKVAVYAGAAAVFGLAAALLAAGAAATVLAGAIGVVGAVLAAGLAIGGVIIGGLVGGFLAVIGILKKVWVAASEFASGKTWGEIGSSIVKGIANGIGAGWTWMKEAISNLAKNAIGAFRDKFQIHSPSRLGWGFGFSLPQGQALGIRAGAPLVDRAIHDLPAPPAQDGAPAPEIRVAAPRGGGAGPAAPSGPLVGHLEVNIQAGNVSDPAELSRMAVDALNEALEKMRIGMGAPAAAPVIG